MPRLVNDPHPIRRHIIRQGVERMLEIIRHPKSWSVEAQPVGDRMRKIIELLGSKERFTQNEGPSPEAWAEATRLLREINNYVPPTYLLARKEAASPEEWDESLRLVRQAGVPSFYLRGWEREAAAAADRAG